MRLPRQAVNELSAPGIVNEHSCAKIGRLHNCLNLAAILRPLSVSLCEEEIDRAPLVAVAALKEGVSVKKVLQAVFCRATFEKFLPNSFRHEHD